MKQYPLQKAKSENMFSDTIIFICTLAYRVISHGRLWKVSRTNVNEKGFTWSENQNVFLLLLLLSHFGCVWPCVTPQMAAHQAPLSLGFSRQKHWSGLPVPSLMHESEKWKWSRSVSVQLLVTPWTAAYQAPPPMGFSRQEYWSGVPLPSPRMFF